MAQKQAVFFYDGEGNWTVYFCQKQAIEDAQ
jgi:hypothetical protein